MRPEIDRPLRVGIVGTGGIARAHVTALRTFPDQAELVAATDLDPGRAAAFSSSWQVPRRYPSLKDMLVEERLDLVHLCTPPGAHAADAVTCLEAGVSVLCEKPPCLSLGEFDRIAAAERSGGTHFIGVFQHRFGTAIEAAKEAIDAGRFGRPLLAVCHTLWYRDDAYYQVDWRGRWETEGGGPTMGHGIHQIDLLGDLLGDWRSVVASAPRLARDVATEDVSFAHITFDSGAVASVISSVLSPAEHAYLRIDFSGGTLEFEPGGGADARRYTPVPGSPAPWSWPAAAEPGSHAAQLGEVLAALRAGRRPRATGAGLRRTIELITAIYAASFGDGRVDRAELDEQHPYYHRIDGRRLHRRSDR